MSVRPTVQSRASARVDATRTRATVLAVAACAMLLVAATPAPVLAVSTRDLIELSKAGLSDDVLVALIEADGTVFNLDAPRILELRDAGVSERVITAMLRNASRPAFDVTTAAVNQPAVAVPPAAAAERDGAPYFVIIGEKPEATAPPPQPTYYLPWIPWTNVHARPVRPARPTMEYRGFGRFINDGWVDNTRR